MKKYSLLLLNLLLLLTLPAWAQNDDSPYDFYQDDKVREIRVEFDGKNWQSQLDSLRTYGDNLLPGSMTIDGESLSQKVGLRFGNARTFKVGNPRNTYHVELDFVDKDQRFKGLRNLVLSEALRDPSMVREVLGLEIARQYMVAPRANYCRLFINNEYIGLFVNVEAIDDVFLERHFKTTTGAFFKGDPTDPKNPPAGCKKNLYASLEYDPKGEACYAMNYKMLSESGWSKLIELTRELDAGTDNIESILDVDQTLWMLAFNNVVVNLSSYSGQHSKNFYLYQKENGQFIPILYDLNLAFGSYKNTGEGSDLDLKGLQNLDPLLHKNTPTKPLISKLLANKTYEKIYLSHIRTILRDYFSNGEYDKRAKDLQRLIMVPFFNDQNKYYQAEDFNRSLTSTIGEKSKIPGIMELMSKRTRYLKKYKSLAVAEPDIAEPVVEKREKFGNKRISTFRISAAIGNYPTMVHVFYRYLPNQRYTMVRMYDDGKHNDGEKGDNVFGAEIDPNGSFNEIEYYIMAENAGTASFSPANYRLMPHKVTLDSLNQ